MAQYNEETITCPICFKETALVDCFHHAAECRAAEIERRASALPELNARLVHFLTSGVRESYSQNNVYEPISEILENRLFLGSAVGARDHLLLKTHNIELVVNCAREISPPDDSFRVLSGIASYLHLKINDVPQFDIFVDLHRGADAIRDCKGPSFVHCAFGVSRSASIVLAYLVRDEGMSLLEALTMLKERRPVVYPNKGFLSQLMKFELEVTGQSTVPSIALSLHSNLETPLVQN